MNEQKSVNGMGKEINDKVVDRIINELAYGLNQKKMNMQAREAALERSPIRHVFESNNI